MSTEQTEQGQQWRKEEGYFSGTRWRCIRIYEGNRLVAEGVSPEYADQIITDHNEAAQLRGYKARVQPVIDCLIQECEGHESPLWANRRLSEIVIFEGGFKYLVHYLDALTPSQETHDE